MEVYRETVNRQGKSRGEKKVGLQRSFLFLHSSPFIHSFIYFEIFLSNCFFLEIFIPNSTILHFVSSPTSNPASKDHTRPFPVFCNAHAYFPLPRTYFIVVISCYCYFFLPPLQSSFLFFFAEQNVHNDRRKLQPYRRIHDVVTALATTKWNSPARDAGIHCSNAPKN